jgi:hypothetical protein
MLILSPSDSQLDEELRLYAQEFQHSLLPSLNLKKEPSPKARRPVLNPNASPHANRLRAHLASQKYSTRTKQDQMHSKMIAAKALARHTPQEAPLYTVCIPSHTRVGTPIVSLRNSYKPRS